MRIAVPLSLALTLVVLSAQAVPTITGGYIEAVRAKSTRVAACSLEGRPARVEKPSWPGTIREADTGRQFKFMYWCYLTYIDTRVLRRSAIRVVLRNLAGRCENGGGAYR
jgi:hypothetical protein